jgi:hypothetical protein
VTAAELSEDQVATALAVDATAAGTAALLSGWNERSVSAQHVLQRVAASPRLQRVAAFCAQAQGRTTGTLAEERIRALTSGLRRVREQRARK